MKRASLLTILIALMAMFFAACGDDSSSNGPSSDEPTAFFPSDFANKKVEAWYMYKETQKDGTQRVMAVFCFSDGTGIATTYRLKSSGAESRIVEAVFEYTIESGDYTTGKVSVSMAGGMKRSFEITDGDMNSPLLEHALTKQDNSKVPAASEPGENPGNGGSGDNGDPSGGNGSVENEDVSAFLPTEYAKKTVVAWYSAEIERSPTQVKIEGVFLFDDNTMIVTKHKVKSDGRESREIMFSGPWELLEGDYESGKLSIDNGDMEVTIVDGSIDVQGERYVKQDNSKVPAASDVLEEEK